MMESNDMWDKVESVLDDVRPMIQSDGGDVDLVNITEDGVVQVQLQGACVSCPSSMITLKHGIERLMLEQVPEVTQVVAVNVF